MSELLKKYEEEALKVFDENFVSNENILRLADMAQLSDDDKNQIREFLSAIDEETRHFIWLFYYIQFQSGEDFTKDKWEIDKIPMPPKCEEKFPGMIKTVVYLLAYENLLLWIKERNLSESIADGYFDRYRAIVSLNHISHNTCGLCRLSPFLYGYAKPFMLRIGRLAYEVIEYRDYCEMYENQGGERIFAALPNYTYDEYGLQSEDGKVPSYRCDESRVYAHIFDEAGKLSKEQMCIDLNEYTKILSPGDNVITIHIPEGGKLEVKDVLDSIRDAKEIFTAHFEPFKAIVCHTWFIDRALRGEVIKDSSNMAAFADLFDVISGSDNKYHSVFEHIFKTVPQPFENLVPQNSFQQRALDYVKNGKRLYWAYGVLRNDII